VDLSFDKVASACVAGLAEDQRRSPGKTTPQNQHSAKVPRYVLD
jgi:hypothetical protein